VLKNVTLHA